MAAQYGKMAKRDVIPPWAETMVNYVGWIPPGDRKGLQFVALGRNHTGEKLPRGWFPSAMVMKSQNFITSNDCTRQT
jgi:hypothetical protein